MLTTNTKISESKKDNKNILCEFLMKLFLSEVMQEQEAAVRRTATRFIIRLYRHTLFG